MLDFQYSTLNLIIVVHGKGKLKAARKVLNDMIQEQVLNYICLNIGMYMPEAVNNSSYHQDPETLTPKHILIMKICLCAVGTVDKKYM